ncbi:hypothetical protein [Nocardia neocaledoniensis]|uniref:hypothetical protein n=1 Tax=Nocardia neocaledoniensis TaxID=236511 RepID=UPI002458DAB4|nr:hypothetical protein [Nocardia neocaledoniensis]
MTSAPEEAIMKTETTHQAGLRRLILCAAVTGAAAIFPLTAASPAVALPAATPSVVHTTPHHPRCDNWNHHDWEYCDRDRGHRCDKDWGRNHWNDRDWDRCDRGRGGHHWFPWGWFGSS